MRTGPEWEGTRAETKGGGGGGGGGAGADLTARGSNFLFKSVSTPQTTSSNDFLFF